MSLSQYMPPGGHDNRPPRSAHSPQDHPAAHAVAYQGTNLTKDEFFRKQNDIPVEISPADNSLKPIQNFKEALTISGKEVHAQLVRNCNYTRPTPVQKWGIPLLMKGRDVMASAQVGAEMGHSPAHERQGRYGQCAGRGVVNIHSWKKRV